MVWATIAFDVAHAITAISAIILPVHDADTCFLD